MRTRHIALLAALLLASPVSADETKKSEKKVEKVKATVKTPSKAPAKKVPSKTAAKAAPVAPVTPITPKAPAAPKADPAPAPAPEPVPAPPVVVPSAPTSQPVVPTVDPDDVGGILKQIVLSAKTGKWALLVGFIVMLLTWFVNRLFKQQIPASVLPWLAIGLSTVATIAFSLATGTGWLNAVIIGFQQGLVAAGGWSAVGKYIPGLAKKPSPLAPAEPKA